MITSAGPEGKKSFVLRNSGPIANVGLVFDYLIAKHSKIPPTSGVEARHVCPSPRSKLLEDCGVRQGKLGNFSLTKGSFPVLYRTNAARYLAGNHGS